MKYVVNGRVRFEKYFQQTPILFEGMFVNYVGECYKVISIVLKITDNTLFYIVNLEEC